MSNAPRCSVVIVSFNAGALLTEAVESVLQQTEQRLELIVVDNASVDGSVAAAAARFPDPRLQVVRAPANLGPFGAMPLGLAAAQADIIVRLDADDVCEPHRVARLLQAFDASPSVGAFASDAVYVDSGGAALHPIRTPTDPRVLWERSLFSSPIVHSSLALRRQVLDRIPYRTTLPAAGDHDLVARLCEADALRVVAEPLVRFRRSPGGITFSRRAVQEAHRGAVSLMALRRRRGEAEDELTALADAAKDAAQGDVARAIAAASWRLGRAGGPGDMAAYLIASRLALLRATLPLPLVEALASTRRRMLARPSTRGTR